MTTTRPALDRSLDLTPLFAPRSVAVVGASDKGPTLRIFEDLRRIGFDGAIMPVNPRRDELWGGPCYQTIGALPEAPDLVVISVPAKAVIQAVREAADLGAKSIMVNAVGFGEGGDAEGQALGRELRALGSELSIPIAGTNFGGIFHHASRLMTISLATIPEGEGSPVALVGQSGGVTMFVYEALMDRGVEVTTLVASGNEMFITAADYIAHLAEDDSVRVIGCFIEQVKDVDRFREAAALARANGKQVVVLKVGASEEGRAAAAAHTGAVVGSLRAFEALAAECGVVVVATLDELVDSLELLAVTGPLPGARIGAVSHSGGLKDLLMDYASELGAEFPKLTDETLEKVTGLLGPGSSIGNPLDTGFPGLSNPDVYRACVEAVAADPNVDIVLCQEQLPRGPEKKREEAYIRNLSALATREGGFPKPLGTLALVSYSVTDYARAVRKESPGIFVLQEARRALAVVTKAGRAAALVREAAPVAAPAASDIRDELSALRKPGVGVSLSEHDSKRILRAYDIPTTADLIAESADATVEAADSIGYPVVLKVNSATLTHKSELGGVLLDLRDEQAVREGFGRLAAVLEKAGQPPSVLVSEFAAKGTELMLGLTRDTEVGPVVAVGSGGITVELFDDVAVGLPPADEQQAGELLDRTKVGKLVAGYRGAAHDRDGVLRALAGLGRLARELGDLIEAVDVNPLTVTAERCLALDALIVLSPLTEED